MRNISQSDVIIPELCIYYVIFRVASPSNLTLCQFVATTSDTTSSLMPFPLTLFSLTMDQRPEVAPAPVIAAADVESQCAVHHAVEDADAAVDVVAVAVDTDDRHFWVEKLLNKVG